MTETGESIVPGEPINERELQILLALSEYEAALAEGRLCASSSYNLLFNEGYLNSDGDGR